MRAARDRRLTELPGLWFQPQLKDHQIPPSAALYHCRHRFGDLFSPMLSAINDITAEYLFRECPF